MKIEALEQRCLLSAALQDGILTVTGTDAADSILLRKSADQILVEIDGVSTAFPAAEVSQIIGRLGGGDDRLDMSTLAIAADVRGEAGNDLIRSGSAADTLSGGEGADTLGGGRHGDYLRGGQGPDQIRAGHGRDRLRGGKGVDQLKAGTGADLLGGGDGNDEFFSEDRATSDTISGGAGEDVAHGDSLNNKTDLSDAEWYALASGAAPSTADLGNASVVYMPVINLGVGEEGGTFVFRISDGGSVTPYSSGVIDWGDGEVTQARVSGDSGEVAFYGDGHEYTQAGTYQVSIVVTTGTQSFSVSTTAVIDTARQIRWGYRQYVLPETESQVVAGVFRRVPGDDPSDYTALISWSDGTVSEGVVRVNHARLKMIDDMTEFEPGEVLVVRGTHAFGYDNYPARVLLLGSDRKAIANNMCVRICNPFTPEASAAEPISTTTLNTAIDLDLGVIHTAGRSAIFGDAFVATVDWGDGTTSPAAVGGLGSTTDSGFDGGDLTIGATHSYVAPGQYTATVTVTYFDHRTTFTTELNVAAQLPLTWRVGEFAPKLVEGQTWATTLAKFAPLHPGDTPQDYTASVILGESRSINSEIIVNPEGLFELRVNDPMSGVPGGSFVHVTISGFGAEARFLTCLFVDPPVQGYISYLQLRAVQNQQYDDVLGMLQLDFHGTPQPARPAPEDFLLTIDWGDGTQTSGSLEVESEYKSSKTFYLRGTHTYATTGLDLRGRVTVQWGELNWSEVLRAEVAPAV